MKTSDTQVAIIGALLAAQAAFPKIAKTKKGQAGNRAFMYAPHDVVLDAIGPILRANGLLLTHGPEGHEMVTRLDHTSGEWRECRSPMNAEQANMQAFGIEKTYLRRQDAQLILGILTEEDNDSDGGKFVREEPNKAALEKVKKATSVKDLNALFKSMPENERMPMVSVFTARRLELESV